MRYVALLRGINVGGHTVKMERLRELFGEMGCANVRTYIQSGNVFFDAADAEKREALTLMIERHLQAALGYAVPTFLRTIPELERIIALDPFQRLEVTPDMRLCVMFTSERTPQNLVTPLVSPKGDMEIIATTEYEAFVVWHIINGRPPATQKFPGNVLGERTTTRFFHTTAKILEAAKGSAQVY